MASFLHIIFFSLESVWCHSLCSNYASKLNTFLRLSYCTVRHLTFPQEIFDKKNLNYNVARNASVHIVQYNHIEKSEIIFLKIVQDPKMLLIFVLSKRIKFETLQLIQMLHNAKKFGGQIWAFLAWYI